MGLREGVSEGPARGAVRPAGGRGAEPRLMARPRAAGQRLPACPSPRGAACGSVSLPRPPLSSELALGRSGTGTPGERGCPATPAPRDTPPSCFGAHTRGCGDLLRGRPPRGQDQGLGQALASPQLLPDTPTLLWPRGPGGGPPPAGPVAGPVPEAPAWGRLAGSTRTEEEGGRQVTQHSTAGCPDAPPAGAPGSALCQLTGSEATGRGRAVTGSVRSCALP